MRKLIFSLCCICLIQIASAQRYLTPIFSGSDITTNLQYGSAVNYLGENETLLLDIYEPTGDTLSTRPTIVYVHGGGFTDLAQSKDLVHIVAYCDSMARRGYVVASINYRLDSTICNRAVINAMHDAKAAVRFLQDNAAEYRIDTDVIIIGGESAGAVTSLTTTYVNTEGEVQYPPVAPYASDLSVEGVSGNPGFSSETKAAMCLCGGTKTFFQDLLFDTLAMEAASDPPLLLVHGTADQFIPVLYSVELFVRAQNIGLPSLFYAMPGADHCPWFFPLDNSWQYMDTLIEYTVPFLYACVLGSTDGIEEAEINLLSTYPNPSSGEIRVDVGELVGQQVRIHLFDMQGREVYSETHQLAGQILALDFSGLLAGNYLMRMYADEEIYQSVLSIIEEK